MDKLIYNSASLFLKKSSRKNNHLCQLVSEEEKTLSI